MKEEDIVYLHSKHSISAAVNNKGEIFTWGKCKDNVLGHGDNKLSNVSLPVKVDALQG